MDPTELQPKIMNSIVSHKDDVLLSMQAFQAQNNLYSSDKAERLKAQEYLSIIEQARLAPGEVKVQAVRKVVGLYKDLFLPCKKNFISAKLNLQRWMKDQPEVVANAVLCFLEQKEQIFNEPVPDCHCATPEVRKGFEVARKQRQDMSSEKLQWIAIAKDVVESGDDSKKHWQFFLDRVREVAPEMLEP